MRGGEKANTAGMGKAEQKTRNRNSIAKRRGRCAGRFGLHSSAWNHHDRRRSARNEKAKNITINARRCGRGGRSDGVCDEAKDGVDGTPGKGVVSTSITVAHPSLHRTELGSLMRNGDSAIGESTGS